MRRVDVGGHALRVETRGEGPPHFLLLHGLVDTLEIWDAVVPGLADWSEVLRLDQRGHGESTAPQGPYARVDLARDATAVLDAQGIERAVWVGHSMGGIVSMAAALAFPERVAGLVLIGTASRCNERTAGWYEQIATAGERDGNAGLARAIHGKDAHREVRGDAAGIASVTRMLKSLYDDPLTPRLSEISCPVRLLVGENDPMGPRASAIIQQALPDATLEVVPDCGHWIHVKAPEVLLRACEAWRPEA